MIGSFCSKETEELFLGCDPKVFRSIKAVSLRKLDMLNAANSLEDIRISPANHLEKLKGDREGQYSIRINAKWRICFIWSEGAAWDVEIVDYH